MIEETLEDGPFTPQELEKVCENFKSQGISFEVLKDEASEKSEMMNDFSNVVKKAEYRLETYLGQIFYLRLNQADFDRNKQLFAQFGMATTHEENPEELKADISQVVKDSKEQKRLQALLAGALLVMLFSFWLYSFLT